MLLTIRGNSAGRPAKIAPALLMEDVDPSVTSAQVGGQGTNLVLRRQVGDENRRRLRDSRTANPDGRVAAALLIAANHDGRRAKGRQLARCLEADTAAGARDDDDLAGHAHRRCPQGVL